jgi:ribosomal protein L37AE/L43A
MGVPARDLESSLMYERYLVALKRHGRPEEREPSPGHAIRQCVRCGRATVHRLDPEGTWYECNRCGTYA